MQGLLPRLADGELDLAVVNEHPLLPETASTAPAVAAEVSLEADAVSALARTPPPIAPATSKPAAAAHLFLRPPAFAESYMA